MATLKSQPRNMVFEGKIQTLDKFVIYHRNTDASNTAKLLVYGVMGAMTAAKQTYQLLIGTVDTTPHALGDTLTAGWYKCSADGTVTVNAVARTYVAGDFFYLETSGTVGGTGSTVFYAVGGKTLNVGPTGITGTVLQARWAPCQTIYYEIEDIENLKSFYSALMTFKLNTDVHDGE